MHNSCVVAIPFNLSWMQRTPQKEDYFPWMPSTGGYVYIARKVYLNRFWFKIRFNYFIEGEYWYLLLLTEIVYLAYLRIIAHKNHLS